MPKAEHITAYGCVVQKALRRVWDSDTQQEIRQNWMLRITRLARASIKAIRTAVGIVSTLRFPPPFQVILPLSLGGTEAYICLNEQRYFFIQWKVQQHNRHTK